MSTVDSLDLKRAREYIDVRDNNTCCHCNLDFTNDGAVEVGSKGKKLEY